MSSKLTWHCWPLQPWLKAIVNATPVQYVKLKDPPIENPFRSDIRVVGRLWIEGWGLKGDQLEAVFIDHGYEGGIEYAKYCRERYLQAPHVWAWEGPNEPYVGDHASRLALVDFTRGWGETMASWGLRTIGGNFGVSWPSMDGLADLAPMFDYVDIVGAHEYGAKRMYDGVGDWCLHYRQWYPALRSIRGGKMPPLWLGELGIDGGVIGQAKRGWKTYCGSFKEFLGQLAWYDGEIRQDDYVIGGAAFNSGGSGTEWNDFEIAEAESKQYAAYITGEWQEEPVSLEQAIGDMLQAYIVPLNEGAALASAGLALGLVPSSDELDVIYDGTAYRCQAFRTSDDPAHQHIAYCVLGDWGHVAWFEREN